MLPLTPMTPTKLGRYEITDEIGKGAMGVVYLARDPLIGRLVALKTFRIGYSVRDSEMEQFRIRFMREAQSAGILTHPNIVTIHDVVEASDEGLAFIAMEYVRGTNLKLLLQGEQALPLAFVLDVIAQVGDALDYAHSNRVVHRDVKPANILITTDNKVKITDFGIARLDSSNLTQEGQLLGTPNYMAPEQIQGKEVDHRADLFSLGVVLYEMLTRHKPFQGENLTVVSHRIVYDHFTPPQEYVRDLPPGLEPILTKALEKDPARRYQRARDMVEDLRRLIETNRLRDDQLNETQSLASTMVLPPPPPAKALPPAAKAGLFGRLRKAPAPVAPPPPRPAPVSPPPPPPALETTGAVSPASAAALGDASGSSASLPPLPPSPDPEDTNSTAEVPVLVPPPPAKGAPARRSSAAQFALVAGMVVVLGVLAGAGYLLWKRWAQPKAAPAAASLRPPAVPATPAPTPPPAPAVSDPALQLAFARQAFAQKQYGPAITAAQAALMIDPANAEAKDIVAKSQAAQIRARQRQAQATPREPLPSQTVAAVPVVPETPRGPAPGQPPAPVATTVSLRVHLVSDFADGGMLIVSVNGKEMLRKPFEGSKRGGFFRKGPVERRDFAWPLEEVPAGAAAVRVYLAPTGKPAVVRDLSANFAGGSSHGVEVQLGVSGDANANLR
ncbi:MAG TPA: serine/threonine-protein kinase [Thermoanaerobaculia bacterium]|nr:serine/threonine-protein kinase [Thermoanaerobaculia bacterium]